jgi:putative transposase
MDELTQLIQSNPDARELKRALAVQMVLQEYTYYEIRDVLKVSVGFITKWKQSYQQQGIAGLHLRYQGSRGHLKPEQRQAVLAWLKQKNDWNLGELQQHLEEQYDVVFESKQSYYTLFGEVGISWKKTQKRNPKADPKAVEKKTGDYRVVG